jgi:Hemerythrin HHE cation binding domain
VAWVDQYPASLRKRYHPWPNRSRSCSRPARSGQPGRPPTSSSWSWLITGASGGCARPWMTWRAGGGDSVWMLSHSWLRLASLLAVHTRAEEEICYLPATRGRPDRAEHLRVAVADHDDLREAIAEASLCHPGSASWWRAVRVILDSHASHFDREERGLLAGGAAGLSASVRIDRRSWPGSRVESDSPGSAIRRTPAAPCPGMGRACRRPTPERRCPGRPRAAAAASRSGRRARPAAGGVVEPGICPAGGGLPAGDVGALAARLFPPAAGLAAVAVLLVPVVPFRWSAPAGLIAELVRRTRTCGGRRPARPGRRRGRAGVPGGLWSAAARPGRRWR